MINGEETPTQGELKVGETVQLSYVSQHRDDLDDNKTVWENISGGHELSYVGKQEMNSRAYVSAFGFVDQPIKVGSLSGGERNRVHLAKLLQSGGNLIMLDEPTNDLDVETPRLVRRSIGAFCRMCHGDQPR